MQDTLLAQLQAQVNSGQDADIAKQWLPVLRFDENEPFLPLAIGYTIITETQKSPSSKFEFNPDGGTIIEYAIWWDWDIQHLYELEHIWVSLDANGQLIKVEASAHGGKLHMTDDNRLPLENGRITLYSEPGKHAFGFDAQWLKNLADYSIDRCGASAGNGGIHTSNPFGAAKFGNPTALEHRLANLYMKGRKFTPTFNFSQAVDLHDVTLVSWDVLADWIPQRIHWWRDELRRTVPHLKAIFLDCGDTIIDESTEIKEDNGIVLSADLIPHADEMVQQLNENGYRLALVADGDRQSFVNLLQQHQLWDYFENHTISSDVGKLKPEAIMFQTALDALHLDESDYGLVVMVGNNLARDIKGANNMGLISIWLSWSPRRSHTPADASEQPDYTINYPEQLLPLLTEIELNLAAQED